MSASGIISRYACNATHHVLSIFGTCDDVGEISEREKEGETDSHRFSFLKKSRSKICWRISVLVIPQLVWISGPLNVVS